MTPYYEKDGIRIFHGDAREVVATLAPASVDFIFTDPPYGHENNNGDLIHRWESALGRPHAGGSDPRPIATDGYDEANALVRWLFAEAKRVLKDGSCCCCCCGGGGPDPQFARWSLWMDEVLAFKQMVVWDKGPIGMGWHYRRSYEVVLVAQRDKGPCRWYDTTDKVENILRHIRKVIPKATNHPTPKPPALAAHFMALHTQPGDLVLDPFMGGGSTLIAAKELGRQAIGIEIEERWCEMAAKRLSQQVFDFSGVPS